MKTLKTFALAALFPSSKLYAGTAGPSKDEIWLFIIPAILLILFIAIPPLYRFIVKKISEWRKTRPYPPSNSEVFNNGFPEI
jgi:ABC-type sugar transport system permease subunit